MTGRTLQWERDGADWPNSRASRFMRVANVHWHVQELGEGPTLLLIHGTGASTHSWRSLAPYLARHLRVIMPDLPGHGFTGNFGSDRLSLPRMAHSLDQLLRRLDLQPALAVGHSAGAAILIRMCLDGQVVPSGLVSLNGALQPFNGLAGQVFPLMANVLFLNPLVPRVFSWSARDRARVERLIRNTGSRLDDKGIDLYQRLFRSPRHVASALGMMANWDLKALLRDLPRLNTPLLLVVGANDRAVPPATSRQIQNLVPSADLVSLPELGHLAHEEQPAAVADLILQMARRVNVLPPA
ncbi:MAG: alpha/beta fold hydrolase [Rhodospirillales bacterium]|nr:alpha/beta fold hydrolase [Rhodospirillales bacterium]